MSSLKFFENQNVRSSWDAERKLWYFSVVNIVTVLTDSANAAAYWRKLKQRLKAKGNKTVANCHGLIMTAVDGNSRFTDVADPFKQWLARVSYERIEVQSASYLGVDDIVRFEDTYGRVSA